MKNKSVILTSYFFDLLIVTQGNKTNYLDIVIQNLTASHIQCTGKVQEAPLTKTFNAAASGAFNLMPEVTHSNIDPRKRRMSIYI